MQTACFTFSEVKQGTADYEEYLEVRYSIFCEELRRVAGGGNGVVGQAVETDEFDRFSRHVLARHRETGVPVACARLILPNPVGLNVEKRYQITEKPYPDADPSNTAEISRMAVVPFYRRRRKDALTEKRGYPGYEFPSLRCCLEYRRRYQPELVLGVYRELYRLIERHDVRYCMAAMDRVFGRLLTGMGFLFRPIGPWNKQVHPMRRPFLMNVSEAAAHLEKGHPEVMAFLRGGLSSK